MLNIIKSDDKNEQCIQRSDTLANWQSRNPTLKLGEIGYDSTAKRSKIGDGVTAWNSLAYIDDSTIALLGISKKYKHKSQFLKSAYFACKISHNRTTIISKFFAKTLDF